MKVLHITQSAGGIETYLLMAFRHIDQTRFEQLLGCPLENGTLFEKAKQLGVKVFPLDLVRAISPIRDLRGLMDIIRLIRREKPDIVHLHSSKAGVLGRIACWYLGVRCCYTPNAFAFLGDSGLKGLVYLTVEKVMRLTGGTILAASESEKNRAIRDVGFHEERVQVFSNAIETEAMPHEVMEQELHEMPRVLMVGRVVRQKNPEMFIRVARRLRQAVEHIDCVMVGAGFSDFTDPRLKQLVMTAESEGVVRIVPWMERLDVLKEMRKAWVVAVPSRFESFGYVAAEAQLLKRPVVACNVDGLNEVVEDEITGFLVKTDDDAAMSDAILKLLKDETLRETMGQRGLDHIRTRFSIESTISNLETFYQDGYSPSQGDSKKA